MGPKNSDAKQQAEKDWDFLDTFDLLLDKPKEFQLLWMKKLKQ